MNKEDVVKIVDERNESMVARLLNAVHNLLHGRQAMDDGPDGEKEPMEMEKRDKKCPPGKVYDSKTGTCVAKTKKEAEIQSETIFKSIDEEKRLVTGIVLAPNEVDAHGDIYDEDEVRKAAHDFAINGFYSQAPTLGVQHLFKTKKALIVESFLAPADMEVNGSTIKKGTWLITTKVLSDELWESIKKGNFTGYSIGGVAQTEDIQ